MSLKILVAVAENGAIGKNKAMPWHLPEDLAYFKKLTTGGSVIMGHNTYKSLGKALPNRENIVLSRNKDLILPDARLYHSLQLALQEHPEAWIIGGAQIYHLTLPYVKYLYITHVHRNFAGDTFFPAYNAEDFELLSCDNIISRVEDTGLSFCVYRRIKAPQKP